MSLTSFSLLEAGQTLFTITTMEFSPATFALGLAAFCTDIGVSIAYSRQGVELQGLSRE